MKVYRVGYRVGERVGLGSFSCEAEGAQLITIAKAAATLGMMHTTGERVTPDDVEIIAIIELAEGRPL